LDTFKFRQAVDADIKADIVVAVPGGLIEVAGTESLTQSEIMIN